MKKIANILTFSSLFLLILIFWPIAKGEIKYQVNKIPFSINKTLELDKSLIPPNKDFSIVIPKIAATAPIIKNVNPFNKNEFLGSLKKGVAHANGTNLPGEEGNVYLFAHSTDAFYNVSSYNAVFYLIGKLEKGDKIIVYYNDAEYVYCVTDKKTVSAEDIKYLTTNTKEKILTLQTCYPPGTTFKRLIVIAKQTN